jgi:hypothetical protein
MKGATDNAVAVIKAEVVELKESVNARGKHPRFMKFVEENV